MLLWHMPAHSTVGNFKGEFTGLKSRFTYMFHPKFVTGLWHVLHWDKRGKFRNGHQVEIRVHANNQQVALYSALRQTLQRKCRKTYFHEKKKLTVI